MADTKITALSALTGANVATGDELVLVDISDTTMAASGTDKNITAAELAIAVMLLGGLAKKYTALIGNGSATSIAVSHNLSNQYVTVQTFDASTGAQVWADPVLTDVNTVTLGFLTAPATNSIRVVVTG